MKPTTNEQNLTEAEKFLQFAQKVIAIPKTEIDRREQEYKKARRKERRRKL